MKLFGLQANAQLVVNLTGIQAAQTPTETHHAVSSAVGYFKGGDCVSGRLTKKHLKKMPTGSYLVSVFTRDGKRIFAEFVASSMPEREAQWERIVSVYADR